MLTAIWCGVLANPMLRNFDTKISMDIFDAIEF
jgi:hypothetical protein